MTGGTRIDRRWKNFSTTIVECSHGLNRVGQEIVWLLAWSIVHSIVYIVHCTLRTRATNGSIDRNVAEIPCDDDVVTWQGGTSAYCRRLGD
jgi:hypothetical protein